ncbi:hypothetical protein HYT25_03440 [Candidatus Pacearchaeota archaeon]|nr:hypothetical protein [Candidatus Pacearchaeota archaeon]
MIDTKLIKYIQQSFNNGFNAAYIRNSLINQGHHSQNVYDTINYVEDINNKKITQSSSQDTQKSNKKIWIFVSILIIIIVIFFFTKFFSKIISEDELSQGILIELKEGKGVKIEIVGEEHKIIVDSIYDDSIDIIIQSEPINTNLKIGEKKKFDLNNDGFYDLQIRLNSTVNEIAHIEIKKISEEINSFCEEYWQCDEWLECLDGLQTRTCEDLNNCGTVESKPEEEQECVVIGTISTCFEQNGNFCNETEICNGSLINSSDNGKCCLGNCELVIEETLTQQTFLGNCNEFVYVDSELYGINGYYEQQCGNLKWVESDKNLYKWSTCQGDNLRYQEFKIPRWIGDHYDYFPFTKNDYPAFEYCENLGSGWRLPTTEEFTNIRLDGGDPAIISLFNFSLSAGGGCPPKGFGAADEPYHSQDYGAYFSQCGFVLFGTHPCRDDTKKIVICVHD